MPTQECIVGTLLAGIDPHEAPHRALVQVFHACKHDHKLQHRGLEREQCLATGMALLESLYARNPIDGKNVASAALLFALDEYCHHHGKVILNGIRVEAADGEPYYVLPRRGGLLPKYPAKRANFLGYYTKHHHIFPLRYEGIEVSIEVLPQQLPVFISGTVSALVGGFSDGVQPDWLELPKWRAPRLKNSEKRWRSVEELLREAQRRGAQILVLPELTVDKWVLDRLRGWLQDEPNHPLQLVVAGSFHEELGPVELAKEGLAAAERPTEWRNRSVLLDRFGGTLLLQDKLQPFRHDVSLDEAISAGSKVNLIVCELGLLAVAICLDFCEEPAMPVGRLWFELGPHFVFVPSMGEDATNKAHRQRAESLGKLHGSRVLIASQHYEQPTAQGIVHLPSIREPASACPSVFLLICP